MDTPLFFSLVGKMVKISIAEYVSPSQERKIQGKVIQTNGKYVKLLVDGKIVYVRIRYIAIVEEI